MKRIPLTQGKEALVDDDDYGWLMQWKWCYHRDGRGRGYAQRGMTVGSRTDGSRRTKIIRMHRFIMDAPHGVEIDHENRNRLDNQRHNLRLCNDHENARNRGKQAGNYSSKFKGVSWSARHRRWRAHIWVDDRLLYLCSSKNEVEAARCYDAAAQEFYREFARLNFPDDPETRDWRSFRKGRSSRFRGVSWNEYGRQWKSFVSAPGLGTKHVGYFKEELEAARAHDEAARRLIGEDCPYLNFPNP